MKELLQRRLLALLFLIIIAANGVLGCPQVVSSLCRCEDLHNGVSLNCSDSNGAEVLTVLKANQALLGLIQDLVMHRANVRKIPASFFAGLYIKKLDMSYNQMVDIDPNAFSGMSPVLQELILTHNNLTAIPVAPLKELKTLLKLDLSNNTITDLTQDVSMPALPKLYDLNLAYNHICSIHKNAFSGIKDTVQTINLGHNCLTAVPAPAIRGFKQLMSLHMHSNQITVLDALSFMNLPIMNLLNLASNQIAEIKPQAFLNVPQLRYLYLTGNQIGTISANQFAGFDQMEMLDLTNNNLEVVPKSAFAGLSSLRQLYLGNNQIRDVQTDAFANSSIAILILANNKLTALGEGVLNGMPNLQQISLKDNFIESVHANAFYNAPSLAMIDMSGNQLTELPAATFLTQLNLLLIDVSRNKISKVPYPAFNRRVGTVLLQENPLVCNEKVHMLQDGVGVYIPNSEDLICGGKPKPTTTTTKLPQQPFESAIGASEDLAAGTSPGSMESSSSSSTMSRLAINKLAPRIRMPDSAPGMFTNSGSSEPSPVDGPSLADIEPGMEPVHPVNAPPNTRPSILNMRPTNIITRPRSNFGPELIHLPSREPRPARPVKITTAEATEATEPSVDPMLIDHANIADLPTTEDDELAKALAAIPLPTTQATLDLRPTVTDIADNPNIIHPFPVPFLKKGPVLSSSARVHSTTGLSTPIQMTEEESVEVPVETTTTTAHTLPPSIVMAPRRIISSSNPQTPTIDMLDQNRITEKFSEFTLRTQPPDEITTRNASSERKAGFPSTTTIIIVCLVTVAVVMVAVFVGLCVAKHRQMSRLGSSSSDSTTARTNAYVQAQSARVDMIYGTMNRSRSMSLSRPEEQQQAWIYSPSNYCTYYK